MAWSGRLLVATPALVGPVFGRTVVLLLQHSRTDGALGVVLSRPSATPVGRLLPGWLGLATAPGMVFDGGPVQPEAAICLGRLAPGRSAPPGTLALDGAPPLVTVDLDGPPDAVAPSLSALRVFAGYAGWAAGQLEDEVDQGSWWVLDALPGDGFSPEPTQLWRQVLRRQGLPLALAATAPQDPALN